MKKLLFIVPISVLLLFCFCDNPEIASATCTGGVPVTVRVLAKAQASSTYRITITGPGMDQIGPDEYAGGQTIELYVPVGNDRAFHFERYDQNSVLTDTGTTICGIGSEMNTVNITLVSVSTGLSTYMVTYDGNGNTGGSAPSAQTKTQGVALTLSGNTRSLVKAGYTFAGWNTLANSSGTDYAAGASYTADANVTLYAKWTATSSLWVVSDSNLTDPDGNTYTTVTIGTQTWTVENLRTTKYNDGSSITLVTDSAQWSGLSTAAYCFYDNNTSPSEQEKWGSLYNWYSIDAGKLAPTGWRIPTQADWNTLKAYLKDNGYGDKLSADNTGSSIASNTDWSAGNDQCDVGTNISANNSTGFSALPSGQRSTNGSFEWITMQGTWWSSTEDDLSKAYRFWLSANSCQPMVGPATKVDGYSVRLLKE